MLVLIIISIMHLALVSWETWDPQDKRTPCTHFVLKKYAYLLFFIALIPRQFPKHFFAENYRNLCSWAHRSPKSLLSHNRGWKPWVIFLNCGPRGGTSQTFSGSFVSGVQRKTHASERMSVGETMLHVEPTLKGSTHFKHRDSTYRGDGWLLGSWRSFAQSTGVSQVNIKHKTNALRADYRPKSQSAWVTHSG